MRASYGEMAERLKAHAWKACVRGNLYRGFESRSLRQKEALYKMQPDFLRN